MYVRNKAKLILITILLVIFSMQSVMASEVSIEFKIGQLNVKTSGENLTLEAAPYIKNGSTMVPMRSIFEELGYLVEYISDSKKIVSTNGTKRIIMTIGSNKATVDGIEKTMPVSPEVVNGRTFVPLRFISENSNAKVNWIDSSSPITVSMDKRLDIGNFILSEKKLDTNKSPIAVLDVYRKGRGERIEIKGKEVTNIVPLKDSFIIAVLDPVLYTTQIMGYNGELKTLLTDYDVKNSFEFNNNLILHLYNRLKKIDELWRYDGNNLVLIDSDFNMGVFVVSNGHALISKSNSKREYSIIRFTTASWTPESLKLNNVPYDFIIKDYIVDENVIYLLGTKAVGDTAWFYTYQINGSVGTLNPIKVQDNQTVSLENVFQTDTNIYVKLKNVLHVLTPTDLKPIEFYENGSYVQVTLGDTQVINGKLIGIVTNITPSILSVKTSTDGKTQTDVKYDSKFITGLDKTFIINIDNSISFTPTTQYQTLATTTTKSITDYRNMRSNKNLSAVANFRSTVTEMAAHPKKDIKISTMRYFEGLLYVLGTNFNDDNYLRTLDVSTFALGTEVLDVKTIFEIVKMPNGAIILSIQDLNRLNNLLRYTILELKNGVYRNIAVDTKTIQMVIKDSRLMLYGQDTDLKKTKLFNYYSDKFDSIGNTFTLSKWLNYPTGVTFITGKADAETKESVFLLTSALKNVIPEFTLEKMVRLNKTMYGIVGKYTATVVDPDFKSKKLMIVFDTATSKYSVVKAVSAFELAASEYVD